MSFWTRAPSDSLTELRDVCDQGTDPWWQTVAADIDAELDRREGTA